jgi:hypothetical protein
MPKKVTEVKTPKTGSALWLGYAETARANAAKHWDPVERVWEMIESLRCEVRAEDAKSFDNNPDGSSWYDDPERNTEGNARHSGITEKAKAFALRYPNGKPLEELKAETRAYLGELIAKLS